MTKLPSPLVQHCIFEPRKNDFRSEIHRCATAPKCQNGSVTPIRRPNWTDEAENEEILLCRSKNNETSVNRQLSRFYSPNLPSKTLFPIQEKNSQSAQTAAEIAVVRRHSILFSHNRKHLWKKRKLRARKLYQNTEDISNHENNKNKNYLQVTTSSHQLLGQGGFGAVYIGILAGKLVAIKQLHKTIKEKLVENSFCAEMNMFGLDHPNIVKILTFSSLEAEIEIVYEYVSKKNLQQLIHDSEIEIEPMKKVKFCRQIADALQYCHKNNILHLDVKPSNVLISCDGNDCKLTDFGCSRRIHHDQLNVEGNTLNVGQSGTLIYKCPELLRGQQPTIKADVYSYGLLLWECVMRQIPFGGINQHTVVFCVVAKQLRPYINNFVRSEEETKLLRLAKICWEAEPENRPNFSQICHFFTKF
ncbi:Serine/threonine-protein kinase mos [Trichinella britovi]|uniref:non-specific serine/threonine protein kinase n=2 Tax=Trichinella TaxID=6333 RepID=A0A0V1CHI1_TRIBR|nr:Serine/threonine-protein kinase mos [Trichinella murrelli]KRY48715.1 Serine/threonine-protein kinase mos [Trichinella britovi]KRZ93355.1 Serine/threonine-protein kinase mos [Trichinella sp. T8]